jgi:membrane protein implicated in regulation of membrane protease activity
MITGLVLICAGILIALYPPLLSIIVAGLLIFFGTVVLATAYYGRRARGRQTSRVFDFFLRY